MSDSLRTDNARPLDVRSDADRDAKIEQLLLDGLDQYFAARYDQAINVWTRALFLDRSHPRARAYIERARSALAERQRESEELLQNGVGAFERGNIDEARRLLQLAIARGAPADEALAVLDRVNRLETTATARPPARVMADRRPLEPPAPAATKSSRTALLVACAAMVVFGVVGWAVAQGWRIDWQRFLPFDQAPTGVASVPVPNDSELPLPRRGEAALTRARSLALGGHLRDALVVLDLVRPTDPQKSAADRLRSEIQRELRGLAPIIVPDVSERERGEPRAR